MTLCNTIPTDAGLEAVSIPTIIPITSTTMTTRLKRYITRFKDSKWSCFTMCFFCLIVLMTCLAWVVLACTYPNRNLISGSLTLGNSDVLLISRFDQSVKEVHFTQTHGFVPVKIYQGSCSTIGPFSQLRHDTRHLQLPIPSRHRINEPHLTNNSRVSYTFVALDPNYDQVAISCVHIFKDRFDYYQFIVFGRVKRPFSSKCLSSANLTLHEYTGYYFVGLENFHPTNLNITINSYDLEYNVTSLSSTVCSERHKTIQLHHTSGQETCVLAALNTNTFISLQYSAQPQSNVYKNHHIAITTLYYITIVLCASLLLCMCINY